MADVHTPGVIGRLWIWLRSWYTAEPLPIEPDNQIIGDQNAAQNHQDVHPAVRPLVNPNVFPEAFVNWLSPNSRRHLHGQVERYFQERDQHAQMAPPFPAPRLPPPPPPHALAYLHRDNRIYVHEMGHRCPRCGRHIFAGIYDEDGYDEDGETVTASNDGSPASSVYDRYRPYQQHGLLYHEDDVQEGSDASASDRSLGSLYAAQTRILPNPRSQRMRHGFESDSDYVP